MQRKVSKEKFYNAGKSKTSQDLIYQHMSNHYRKILNAKKAIDDGPPQSYKAKRPATSNSGAIKNKLNRQLDSPALTDRSISTNSNKGSSWGTESCAGSSRYHARCIPESPTFGPLIKHTAVDMELVNRITFDTKKGPASYCGEGWTNEKSQNNDKVGSHSKQTTADKGSSPTAKRRLPTTASQELATKRRFACQKKLKPFEMTLKGCKSFSAANDKVYPRILNTNAVSKLRSMRVYHPPRRKKSRNEGGSPTNPRITTPLDVSPYKCSKLEDPNDPGLKKITFNPKEQSLTSSRDSAYNGGISSLPESRSPTPDERKKKECCCCCCEKKLRDMKRSKTDSKTVENENVKPSEKVLQVQKQEECLKKIKEDELYVKFIQDITTEVLEKNLYTNKALKNVMKKHIKNNLIKLNKDRMLKEIEHLRIQLGIPEDESLLKVEGDADESETDAMKSYPIISDSEFVMPNNPSHLNNKNCVRDDEKITEKSDNDGEVLSVIQITKAFREKKKDKHPTALNRKNICDESDQNLSVLRNLKKKIPTSDSSSSSESEVFQRKSWGKKGGEIIESEQNILENFGQKKNRNVSFWKNPELNVNQTGRTIEIKQKKTTIRGKEVMSLDKKEKPKND